LKTLHTSDKVFFCVVVVSNFDSSLPDDVIAVPLAVTGEAIVYAQSIGAINFGRPDLVGIYLGFVQNWNDKNWQLNNPNVTMPSYAVHPLHRTDAGTASSALLLAALTSFSPMWSKPPYDDEIPWPVPNPPDYQHIDTPEAMLATIANKQGALGYVTFSTIYSGNSSNNGVVTMGSVLNKRNQFVAPTLQSLVTTANAVIITESNFRTLSLVDLNCSSCYPLTSFEYLLFRRAALSSNCSSARGLSDFLQFMFSPTADTVKLASGFGTINQTGNALISSVIEQLSKPCVGKNRK
jgi:ABC-type phosphate transport system substrate-binding protein